MKLHIRHTLTDQKTIADPAVRAIMELLNQQMDHDWMNGHRFLPALSQEFEFVWVTRKGKLTTRLAHYFYENFRIKLPKTLLAEIGNIARQHAETGNTYHFEFTDTFDWEDGDFGDGGSCYWGSHEAAREMLVINNALAICFYNEAGDGIGRAWLYDNNDYWIIWNGYGFAGNSTLTIARVFASFIGMSFKKIGLSNRGVIGGMLYINGGIGYAIGSESAIANVTHYDFWWDGLEVCYECGATLDEDDTYRGANDEIYCDHCFYNHFDTCSRCGETDWAENFTRTADDEYVCEDCLAHRYEHCERCDTYYRSETCPNCRK